MKQIEFERKSAGQTQCDCYLCVHENVCKILNTIEGIPMGRSYKISFQCRDFDNQV